MLLYLGVNKGQQELIALTPEEIGLHMFGMKGNKSANGAYSSEILKNKN